MSHFVYILRCSDGTFYTGYATNVANRLQEHNGEGVTAKRGAKYTRGRRPVQVVHTEAYETRSEALKRESVIKKMSRTQKESLLRKVAQP